MEDTSEEVLAELRVRVARLEWFAVGTALCGLAFFAVLALIPTSLIPRFDQLFAEMLAGQALPALTERIIRLGNRGMLGSFAFLVPLAAAIYLVLKHRSPAPWITAFLAILFLLFLAATVSLALYLPFLDILQGLSEAP